MYTNPNVNVLCSFLNLSKNHIFLGRLRGYPFARGLRTCPHIYALVIYLASKFLPVLNDRITNRVLLYCYG